MSTNLPTISRPPSKSSSKSSISSHFAMIELKQRIFNSIAKLSDRDTHQIALSDLQETVQSISSEAIPMLLNCLYEACSDPNKSMVKKDSIALLALLASSWPEPTAPHLSKIISIIVRRLRDSDSSVRESCRDAIGSFSSLYICGDTESSIAPLFVKPLLEALNEQNKTVQVGAAMCLAKMVESARDMPSVAFQKLCHRICKHLSNQNFLAKGALLSLISSLSHVGAVTQQNLPSLVKSINECLMDTDWATRKAAADALSTLASKSSHLVAEVAASTVKTLEACRFDKVKPVRDSIIEALQSWKKIADNEDGFSEAKNSSIREINAQDLPESEKIGSPNIYPHERTPGIPDKNGNRERSELKTSSISEKAVGILKKKAPALTDKLLNADFFQKLETRVSDDLPVEVVLPPRPPNLSQLTEEREPTRDFSVSKTEVRTSEHVQHETGMNFLHRVGGSITSVESSDHKGNTIEGRIENEDSTGSDQRNATGNSFSFSMSEGHADLYSMGNKGNWLGIQRQLAQLERQQANIMGILQDFISSSCDSLKSLENRVQRLERVVEEMVHDLTLSSGSGGNNFVTRSEGRTARFLGGRRDSSWRADVCDPNGYSRSGPACSTRAVDATIINVRHSRTSNDEDQMSNRRPWNKGHGPVRFGEGPSARSMWQAAKDEATLEAIRVAGEDRVSSQTECCATELRSESLDNSEGEDHVQLWDAWIQALDFLQAGDVDSAYAIVISRGDNGLLMKLMDRSGPVIDQLSYETTIEILCIIGKLLLNRSVLDIGLSWMQQLTELLMENTPDFLDISLDIKRYLLMSLREASRFELLDNWDGATAEQLMLQLSSAWRINLEQLEK